MIKIVVGLVLLGAIFAGRAIAEVSQSFNSVNITTVDPVRYHALQLFNNDHPSSKRLAVRSKCDATCVQILQ